MEIKTPYIWKNWEMIAWDEAMDHHLSHSLHYGWWVFEWIRFYDTPKWPKVFRLKEHIERLFYSANFLWLKFDFSKEDLINAVLELVLINNEKTWYIRPIIYSWYWKMWLNPTWAKVETVISLWKWWKYLWEESTNVKIPKIRKTHPKTTDMNAKISWNYANSILVSKEVSSEWFDEWLILDTEWFIAEWPWENVFFVKWNSVITPALWTILPWITRASIIEILKNEFNIIVEERKILPIEIKDFDEAFFTWTAAEVTPISSITLETWEKINLKSYEKNSLSQKIKEMYLNITWWKLDNYKNWLY